MEIMEIAEEEVEEKNVVAEGFRNRIRNRYRRSKKSIHTWFRRKPRIWVILEWINKNFFTCVEDFEEILVTCDGVRWQLYDPEHLITKPPDWYIPWDLEERQIRKFSAADLFEEEDDNGEYWGWTARPIVPKIDPETGSLLFKFKDLEPDDLV